MVRFGTEQLGLSTEFSNLTEGVKSYINRERYYWYTESTDKNEWLLHAMLTYAKSIGLSVYEMPWGKSDWGSINDRGQLFLNREVPEGLIANVFAHELGHWDAGHLKLVPDSKVGMKYNCPRLYREGEFVAESISHLVLHKFGINRIKRSIPYIAERYPKASYIDASIKRQRSQILDSAQNIVKGISQHLVEESVAASRPS